MFTLFIAIIGFIGIGYLIGNKEVQKSLSPEGEEFKER